MVRVMATNASAESNIIIKELGRVAEPGEEFDVSAYRYVILSGKNKYNKIFVVRWINDEPEAEQDINTEENDNVILENIIEEVTPISEDTVKQPKRRKRKHSDE